MSLLEMTPHQPLLISSRSCNQVGLRIENVGVPGGRPSEQDEGQQQIQSTYDTRPPWNPSYISGRRAL